MYFRCLWLGCAACVFIDIIFPDRSSSYFVILDCTNLVIIFVFHSLANNVSDQRNYVEFSMNEAT